MNAGYKSSSQRTDHQTKACRLEARTDKSEIRDECLYFVKSCQDGNPDFGSLDLICGFIDERVDEDDFSETNILKFIDKALEYDHEPSIMMILSKFCRKWSRFDKDFGYLFFNDKILDRICDLIVSFEDSEGAIWENLLITVANLLLELGDQLNEQTFSRIVEINMNCYLYLAKNKKNVLAANVFLTSVLAHTFKTKLDLATFTSWAQSLFSILRDSDVMDNEQLIDMTLSSLTQVLVHPSIEKPFATPWFLQEVWPVYLTIDDCRISAYSVFCRLATSSDEQVRKSTISLAPMNRIADQMCEKENEKHVFCQTISDVIIANEDDIFHFDDKGIIEAIAALTSPQESYQVRLEALRCIDRIFEYTQSDYGAQWRLMRGVVAGIADFMEDCQEEFSRLLYNVFHFMEKLRTAECAYYLSFIASAIALIEPPDADSEAVRIRMLNMLNTTV